MLQSCGGVICAPAAYIILQKERKHMDNRIPRHIAIIMDGNGRWAKMRNLPRNAGHKAGAETFRKIVAHCHRIGVKYLTVYAFSTENWKRSAEEVSGIMRLLEMYLKEALRDMEKNKIRFKIFGDITRLTPSLQRMCQETMARSALYTEFQVNFCLNYGGRDEIVRAARSFAEDVALGKRSADSLTEELFSQYLDSVGVPDPDVVIRPSGELRTSNFLPWQSAYSELVFMDVLWPDFTEEHLDLAIAQFLSRNRRFGGA
jgi:undecaprenyl diphosphate synthase